MTYKIGIDGIKEIYDSLQWKHNAKEHGKPIRCECHICSEIYSLVQSMIITNQRFVYIRGQPDY